MFDDLNPEKEELSINDYLLLALSFVVAIGWAGLLVLGGIWIARQF